MEAVNEEVMGTGGLTGCNAHPSGEIRVYEYVYEYGRQSTQPYSYTYSYTQLSSMASPV